jgi:hypothetical protein
MNATKDAQDLARGADRTPDDPTAQPGPSGATDRPARSSELHNDSTHDSSVDTDGKNREAARLANHEPISVDEITTSNATLDNSVAEARDGLAGFDSRLGGNKVLLALRPDYEVVDRGIELVEIPYVHDAAPPTSTRDEAEPLQQRWRTTRRFEIRRTKKPH